VGRRSRKRRGAGEAGAASSSRAERDAARERRAQQTAAQGDRTLGRARGRARRPDPPWGRFPLTELVILLALVLCVVGFLIGVEEPRGRMFFLAGVALGTLGGLELAVRDHFAGWRSHTTLLSLAAAVATVAVLGLVLKAVVPSLSGGLLLVVSLAVAAPVFTITFVRLRRVFQDRSGGLSFR
jgi:hypothetical protein